MALSRETSGHLFTVQRPQRIHHVTRQAASQFLKDRVFSLRKDIVVNADRNAQR